MAGSIAIFTDSAHLASDLLGFGVSILGMVLAERKAEGHLTFGWHRAEIIGTMISISCIWVMTVWLLVEATKRFFEPPQVKGDIMLIVAVMGLIFNLIQMKILHSGEGHYHLGGEHEHDHDHDHQAHAGHNHDHGHDHSHAINGQDKAKKRIKDEEVKKTLLNNEEGHQAEEDHGHAHAHEPASNINIDSAYVHVLGDMLMSVGVIIAATIIYFFPSCWYADPLCTYLFSIIVCFTTIPIIKTVISVMMEGTPKNIDAEALTADLRNLDRGADIIDVHDLHVWRLGMNRTSLTVHIKSTKPLKTLNSATDLLRRKYGLQHTTIQVEGVDDTEKNPHTFKCENDIHQ